VEQQLQAIASIEDLERIHDAILDVGSWEQLLAVS
jgi:hypothetical protein